MRAALLLLFTLAFSGAAAPSAGAQGPAAIASTRVTVIVPDRPHSRGASSRPATLPASASSRSSGVERFGRSDRTACVEIIDLGAIGRASVSCLETAELAAAPAGVLIELEPGVPAASAGDEIVALELVLDGDAVIRLPLRAYTRAGRPIRLATVPAHAFHRIAASRSLCARVSGVSSDIGTEGRSALRRLAAALNAAPVHPEQARH